MKLYLGNIWVTTYRRLDNDCYHSHLGVCRRFCARVLGQLVCDGGACWAIQTHDRNLP